jgi:hypothetical protein
MEHIKFQVNYQRHLYEPFNNFKSVYCIKTLTFVVKALKRVVTNNRFGQGCTISGNYGARDK